MKRPKFLALSISVLLIAASLNAAAQISDPARETLQDPSLQGETVSGISSAAVTASHEETSIAAEFKVLGDAYDTRYWDLAIGLKAPIDKDEDSGNLADLSGLSTGTVASIKFQHVWLGSKLNEARIGETCAEYDAEQSIKNDGPPSARLANCAALATLPRQVPNGPVDWIAVQNRLDSEETGAPGAPVKSGPPPGLGANRDWQRDAVDLALTATCREVIQTGVGQPLIELSKSQPPDKPACRYRSLVVSLETLKAIGTAWYEKAEKAIVAGLLARCQSENKDLLTGQLTDPSGFIVEAPEGGSCTTAVLSGKGPLWRQKAFDKIGYHPWILAAQVSAGDKSFKFLDATTLERGRTDGTAYSLTASLGRLHLGSQDFYYGIGYSDEHSFQAGDRTQICQPIGTTGALQCSNETLGAPSRTHEKITFAEMRSLIYGKFGVHPRISYDYEESVVGYQLQLYFIPNADKALTGGLDLGYRNDTHDFTVGLFVGVPFSVFQ